MPVSWNVDEEMDVRVKARNIEIRGLQRLMSRYEQPESSTESSEEEPEGVDRHVNNGTNGTGRDRIGRGNIRKKWPPRFRYKDVIFACIAWFTFAVDYGTDIRLMTEYYLSKQLMLLGLTLSFIAVPAFITSVISILWYNQKYKEEKHSHEIDKNDSPEKQKWKEKRRIISKKLFAFRLGFSFVQLGRIFRQLEYIYCICRSLYLQRRLQSVKIEKERKDLERKDRNLRRHAVFEKRDAAILGLLDGFLESAMQLSLQLYLAVAFSLPLSFPRVTSVCASLMATALIQTAFYRTNRKANKTRKTVTYLSSFVYFLCRLFELTPRYLVLSLTCAVFIPWCFIVVPVHMAFVCGIYGWRSPELRGICPEARPCLSKNLRYLFILTISFMGVFTFVNITEGESRKPAALFYTVFYIENICMTGLLLWYPYDVELAQEWLWTLWTMPVGMVLHVTFAAVFYECLHPKAREARSDDHEENSERTVDKRNSAIENN